MAELNLDYYKGEDHYSDGDVENDIFEIVKNRKELNSLRDCELNYAIAYHLSQLRENIVNWYEFKPESKVLEIGSGCGAITGLLCNNCKDVVSVELSKRRAQINYERHKEYGNLRIYVGNLNDMSLDTDFDYIIVNGVFEYAISFTEGDNPYVTFLNKICKFMNDNGRILIAIENRLGLKYFAGSSEDHLKNHFIGLNNYSGVRTVKTFSKTELKSLLLAAGLDNYKFYYPYPDYKFPKEIFTDETINKMTYGRNDVHYEEDRVNIFNSSEMFSTLASEGVNSVFANSFLVEASRSEIDSKEELLYAKISNDRKPEYQIKTTIIKNKSGKKIVKKEGLNEKTFDHIEKLYTRSGIQNGKTRNIDCTKSEDNALIFDYINVDNLDTIAFNYIKSNEIESFKNVLLDVEKQFFSSKNNVENIYSEDFIKVFGSEYERSEYECICPANIDIILDNIYVTNSEYVVIDCEWVFDFDIPIKFIMWRLINEFFVKHTISNVSRKEVLNWFHIDEVDEEIFYNWGYNFAVNYVGTDSLKNIYKDTININIDDMICKELNKNKIFTKLYLNTGDGYSEDHAIDMISDLNKHDNTFSVSYDLHTISDLQSLRWDPSVDPCICEDICIYIDGEIVNYKNNCFYKESNKEFFYDNESSYEINSLPDIINELKVVGRFYYLDHHKANDDLELFYNRIINKKEEEIRNYLDQNKRLEEECKKIKQENADLNQENNVIKQENEMQIQKNEELLQNNKELKNILVETVEKKNEYINRYDAIINSKTWKYTSFFRKIFNNN